MTCVGITSTHVEKLSVAALPTTVVLVRQGQEVIPEACWPPILVKESSTGLVRDPERD